MTTRDPLDHGWWLASRSAGIVAYLLLSCAVLLGLAMALRLAPAQLRGVVRQAHERVALLALGAIGAHALLLLGDGFLRPGLSGILVPFTMRHRLLWTGLGILAAYLTAGLALTFYARRRLGPARWRTAHRLIPAAWLLAAVHALGAGSDTGSLWLQAPLALTLAAGLTLLGFRLPGTATGAGAPAVATAPPVATPPSPPPPRPERLWATDR